MSVHDQAKIIEYHTFGHGLDHICRLAILKCQSTEVSGQNLLLIDLCFIGIGRRQGQGFTLLGCTDKSDAVLESAGNEQAAHVTGGIGQNQVARLQQTINFRFLFVAEAYQVSGG